MAQRKKSQKIHTSPDWPVWYNHLAPLGSAVRYVASFSREVKWVGVFVLGRRGSVKPGPSLGTAPSSKAKAKRVSFPVETPAGALVGRLDVVGELPPEHRRMIQQVTRELGELWPA